MQFKKTVQSNFFHFINNATSLYITILSFVYSFVVFTCNTLWITLNMHTEKVTHFLYKLSFLIGLLSSINTCTVYGNESQLSTAVYFVTIIVQEYWYILQYTGIFSGSCTFIASSNQCCIAFNLLISSDLHST